VIGLLLVHLFVPQRSGVLALTEVLEPFIVLTALVLVPLALVGRERVGVAVVVVLLVTLGVRYAPGVLAHYPGEPPGNLTVTAWNVEAGDYGGQRVLEGLAGTTSDLVGLEEFQPDMANALETDPTFAAAYPYRALYPNSIVLGVGLLSRYPILEQSSTVTDVARADASEPPYLRAVVVLLAGERLVVYVVHPLPGRIQTAFGIPFALDTTKRDQDLATIRTAIDTDLSAGRAVLVMGDINTTTREPAFADFSKNLIDARYAGPWPGLTWRWDPLKSLVPFGLLRIDYVLTNMTPVDYSVRCTNLSDHCIVSAGLN
jgi:endonuclease/exonuclease/phosphatase family metal-dependent hydrolase